MIESTELLKKLQVKAGARLPLLNVPAPFAAALTAGAEVEVVRPGDAFTGAIAFCSSPADVTAAAAQILPALPPDGLLWFAYRKGAAAKAAGLSRDVGWASLKEARYDTVRSISLSDEWTGLRFRHSTLIGR